MALPFLVSFLINAALGIGLSLVASKIQERKVNKQLQRLQDTQVRESAGAIIEVEYGEATPRRVAVGKCATRGLACYDNAFGEANKRLQRVIKLSDYYTTAMTRVAIDGEWVTLGSLDSTLGYPVASGAYSGLIWVKFYDGRQTSADAYLTGNDNPDGRWTTNHIGIAVSYAVVTFDYDDEKMTSLPEVLVEFTGAPAYDVRKDSTAGGSGSHRYDNPATWEYTENPIVLLHTYMLGFYTGAYGSGHDLFLGMNHAASELDATRFATAATICDQTVEGEARYRVGMFIEADRTHGETVADLLQSCAGIAAETVDKFFPVINGALEPVATLTDEELVEGFEVTIRPQMPMDQTVNTVFGTYTEPSLVYATAAYAAQTDAGEVTIDRRTLDMQLNFPMVPSKRQAQQLASIAFSENRFGRMKTVTVREKWQTLELGDWITWEDDDPGVDREYQITGITLASAGDATPRVVTLQLLQRDDSIYAGVGPVSPPSPAGRQGAPAYLQELQSFAVAPIYVPGDDGAEVPAIAVSWAAVTDPTVDRIILRWWPKATPTVVFEKHFSRYATTAKLQDGVVGSTLYEVVNQIDARPVRTTVQSAPYEVTTGANRAINFAALSAEVRESMERQARDLRRVLGLAAEAPLGIAESIIATADAAVSRRTLRAQGGSIGDLKAEVIAERSARIEGDTAIASDLVAVEAQAGQASAGGLYKLEAVAAPGGVTSRFGVFLRATDGDSFTAEAAEFLEIVGGQSRKVIAADRTVIANSSGTILALFDPTGAYFDNARIIDLTANNISAGAITTSLLAAGAVTADKITAGTITANEIISAGISSLFSNTPWTGTVNTASATPAVVGNTLAISVPSGAGVLVQAIVSGGPVATDTGWAGQIYRDGSALGDQNFMGPTVSGGLFWSNTQTLIAVDYPSAGTVTYDFRHWRSSGSGNATTRRVFIQALMVRR